MTLRKPLLAGLGALLAALFLVVRANAQDIETVVFFDDFEEADPIGTILPDTPPIGEDWKKYNANSTDSFIAANPESEARNTSPLSYSDARPDPPTPGVGVALMIAPLAEVHQDLIETNGNAKISFKYYDTGQQYGLSFIANEATPGTVPTGLAATGLSFLNGTLNQAGFGNSNLTYTTTDWHDIELNLDFVAQQYTLSVDGILGSSAIPFLDNGRATLTNLWFGHYARPSHYYIDDVRVSTTGPAPSSLREWVTPGAGTWTNFTNWSPAFVPDAAGDQALFGTAISAPSTVAVDSAVTVNAIEFNNAITYALAGTGSVTLAGSNPSILVSNGNHQFQVRVNFEENTSIDGAGGSLDFNNQIDLAGNMLSTVGAVNINHSVVDSIGSGAIVNSGTLGTAGSTSLEGTLTSTGTLDIDISGAGTGQSDRFDVIGAANLEGVVDVDVLGSFSPTSDITILTTTAGINLTGSLTLAGPDSGLFSGVSVVGNNLVLAVGGGGLAGDYNGDDVVNAADYVVWRKSIGTTDGYNLWRDHYGSTGGSGAGGNAQAAVPEPTAMLLLFVGLGSIATRTSRFRLVSSRHSRVD
jgi:hypothetical protein